MSTTGTALFEPRGRGFRRRVPFVGLSARLARIVDGAPVQWPSPRWRDDPAGFARDVLGIDLWAKQVEMLESICAVRNTTVRSGHKCGKTTALAVAALWFYASFADARVLMTAVKATQIDEAMWREVRRLHRESKIPLDGHCGERANYGLRADDGRQIWGMTARDGEALAGISGENILILVDEASGVKDRFFEALGSSLAADTGVVRKCYISNPTRTTGEFYRSHTSSATDFRRIHISSEDTPNARGTGRVKGLCGPEWIAEKKLEYGEESHAYRVRVKGEFVHDKDGKINSLESITEAMHRWDDVPDTGQLQIGIDPAGDGVKGDESAFAVRRGMKITTLQAKRGLTVDAIVARAIGYLHVYRRPGDRPRIAIDTGGGIGSELFGRLRALAEVEDFELINVAAEQVMWGSRAYHKKRDGLWGECSEWIKVGGALPDDVKLSQELNAPAFVKMVAGRDKHERAVVTDKDVLRRELGRSPDRADAVNLAVWGWKLDGDSMRADDGEAHRARVSAAQDVYEPPPNLDGDGVYGGSDGVYG